MLYYIILYSIILYFILLIWGVLPGGILSNHQRQPWSSRGPPGRLQGSQQASKFLSCIHGASPREAQRADGEALRESQRDAL